jgi:hypothetical protein
MVGLADLERAKGLNWYPIRGISAYQCFPKWKNLAPYVNGPHAPSAILFLMRLHETSPPSGHPYPLQATATNGYRGHLYVSMFIGVVGVLQLWIYICIHIG